MKTHFPIILKEIFNYLMVDEYNPEGIHELLGFFGAEKKNSAMHELRNIIVEQRWSREDYEHLTGIEIETDRQLYEHLEEVWQYAFNNGPEPEIEKYEY